MPFWLLRSPVDRATVVLQANSVGPWITDQAADGGVPTPVCYWHIRDGRMAAVLGDNANATLFRRDLLLALDDIGVGTLARFPARIERVRDQKVWEDYSLVQPTVRIPPELFSRAPASVLLLAADLPYVIFSIQGRADAILVDDRLRYAIEQRGIPDLVFCEPDFIGALDWQSPSEPRRR